MGNARKEWEDRYDKIKNMTEVEPMERIEDELKGKEAQFAARLSKIQDSTSREYREIVAERRTVRREYEEAKKDNSFLRANFATIKKNFPLIDKTRENRDVYQQLLDELLDAKNKNKQKQENRVRLGEEAKKLEDELKELKEWEEYCLNALGNPNVPEENKKNARVQLEDVRKQMSLNHDAFSKNQKDLEKELNEPFIEINEDEIKELENKIDRCNKICEKLLEGKDLKTVQEELGKEKTTEKTIQVEGTPTEQAPEQPAAKAPAPEQPVQEAPVQEVPAQEAPAQDVPAQEAPVQEAPEAEAPEAEAPAQEAPAQDVETIAQDIFSKLSQKDKEDLAVQMADLAIVYATEATTDKWNKYISLPDDIKKAVQNKVREMCGKELEAEKPAQEAPAQEAPSQGTTKRESFWDMVKRFAEERAGEEMEAGESETPGVEQPKAPIEQIRMFITKDGSSLLTLRNDTWDQEGEQTRLGKKNLGDIEAGIDPELLEQAKSIGDEFVIRDILLKLDDKEKEEQLRKYIEVLRGDYTQDSPFNINYYLQDIRKSGLTKEERKKLINNAKKIRDLNRKIEKETGIEYALGEVEVSVGREILWSLQDLGNGISSGIKKMWDNITTKRLPKGKGEQIGEEPLAQVADEQEIPVQADPEQEVSAPENTNQSRVAGVERVEVDVAKVVEAHNENAVEQPEHEVEQPESEDLELPF